MNYFILNSLMPLCYCGLYHTASGYIPLWILENTTSMWLCVFVGKSFELFIGKYDNQEWSLPQYSAKSVR